MFYESLEERTIFSVFHLVGGSSIRAGDLKKLNKPSKKSSSVLAAAPGTSGNDSA